ncbi:Ser/Thr protein kinase RdoA involved in Cpx stress response, MazF antagonist [Blastococcus aurantiacus]|uniref:Ser/Thr protein kinase RdoA involved in Cpx stress response, MazF antagonist n=1 Tax=Blastococcus aurantiacus TaxID=1550231 RepID=A0A1G7JI23_9ACTN|nr:Ser/Thr protein kinase RdoA involved in Cpx stress response, MazF antagonist [Blastococcus aurantiacus]
MPGVDSRDGSRDWVRSVPSVATVSRLVESEYRVAVTGAVLVRSSTNDVYRVDTAVRSYAVKVYGAGRWTPDEVRWEQQLARHLTDSGFPIAADVPLADGDTVGILSAPEGERPVAMAEWMPGEKPQPPGTDALYRDLGRSLAQFHVAADHFRSSRPRRTVRTASEVREVSDVLDTDSPRRRLIEGAAAEAQRQLTRLADQGLHWGIRHGDASLDNIHVSDSGLHFYDLDLAGPGWQVEDLTPALSTGFADAFLAGYTAVRPLPSVELEALPWLRIMNCLQNLHFHLVRRPASEGTASLAEGWVEAGFEALAATAGPLGLDI